MVRSDRRLDTLHDEHSMKQSPRPNELDDVRGNGRMTWREADRVWFTAPEEVLHALSGEGVEECTREVTAGVTAEPPGRVAGHQHADGNCRVDDLSESEADRHREDGGEA